MIDEQGKRWLGNLGGAVAAIGLGPDLVNATIGPVQDFLDTRYAAWLAVVLGWCWYALCFAGIFFITRSTLELAIGFALIGAARFAF